MTGRAAPPHRIETERLVLRAWDPADAPLLKEALDASLDHLRPWMPWAHDEPKPVEEKLELLRGFRAAFDQGEDFVYGIFDVAGIERIEIHCDPRNERSAAVPRRLGFVHEATLRGRLRDHDGTPRDAMVWTLHAEAFAASPCALLGRA
jgi:RimJ/RimL family protein N-acetyltransferase